MQNISYEKLVLLSIYVSTIEFITKKCSMSDDVMILSSRVLLMYIILCLRPALEMRISETESSGILRNAHKKRQTR